MERGDLIRDEEAVGHRNAAGVVDRTGEGLKLPGPGDLYRELSRSAKPGYVTKGRDNIIFTTKLRGPTSQ